MISPAFRPVRAKAGRVSSQAIIANGLPPID